jgi:hypothetical protein
MESLGYILIRFLRGSLPWDSLGGATKNYERIMEKKTATSIDALCSGLPDEFGTFLQYTRALQFDEKPNYSYLRGLFGSLCAREEYQYDSVFDWSSVGSNGQDNRSCSTKVMANAKRSSDRTYVQFFQ